MVVTAESDTSEIPIFICYRRVDGTRQAALIFDLIEGRLVDLGMGGRATLRAFLDVNLGAVANWTEHHGPALERSRAMLIVITPGMAADLSESGEPDWVRQEIRWWIEHRRDVAPILIDCTGQGTRFLPDFSKKMWSRANRIPLDIDALDRADDQVRTVLRESLGQRLAEGVRDREGLVRYQDLERYRSLLRRTRIALLGVGLLMVVRRPGRCQRPSPVGGRTCRLSRHHTSIFRHGRQDARV